MARSPPLGLGSARLTTGRRESRRGAGFLLRMSPERSRNGGRVEAVRPGLTSCNLPGGNVAIVKPFSRLLRRGRVSAAITIIPQPCHVIVPTHRDEDGLKSVSLPSVATSWALVMVFGPLAPVNSNVPFNSSPNVRTSSAVLWMSVASTCITGLSGDRCQDLSQSATMSPPVAYVGL